MQITPETKVGPLLDAHPELVAPLIAYVPAFDKLKNPVLRRTVARFATLEHAARVGGVALPDLLAFLRRALGQAEGGCGAEAGRSAVTAQVPAWFRPEAVALELDAEALLAEGGHPLGRVRQELASRPAGAVVALGSPFEPAPLLEALAGEGLLVWCAPSPGGFRTCIRRP